AGEKISRLYNRRYLYEAMFIHFFKRLTNQQDVRILFCTHALPSNIASVLKLQNKLPSVTDNVYTDFFVNDVWGIEGIDYHFAPTLTVKNYSTEQGVMKEAFYVKRIPTGHELQRREGETESKEAIIKVRETDGRP